MELDLEAVLESLGAARRFADPAAPHEARAMAARGALPLPPPQIATVLYALTFDGDPEIKQLAAQSLAELPDRVVDPALEGELPPGLLSWFADRFKENQARIEKIALNKATADQTICQLAALPFPSVVDIIANNQLRLMRCPGILEALGDNVLTGQATIDRILDFLGLRSHESPEAPEEQPPEDEPEAEAEAAELPSEVADLDLESTDGLPPELLGDDEEFDGEFSEEEQDERGRSIFALIQDMNVIQKIKLARFGSGEARAILIRDRNRIVASAAVRSPKIKESEVVGFAKARNIAEEVLRIIANNREWTKTYAIQLALATNPKCPVPSAMKFLNYLSDRDLKMIMRSRDVQGPISTQARRILARKGKI